MLTADLAHRPYEDKESTIHDKLRSKSYADMSPLLHEGSKVARLEISSWWWWNGGLHYASTSFRKCSTSNAAMQPVKQSNFKGARLAIAGTGTECISRDINGERTECHSFMFIHNGHHAECVTKLGLLPKKASAAALTDGNDHTCASGRNGLPPLFVLYVSSSKHAWHACGCTTWLRKNVIFII